MVCVMAGALSLAGVIPLLGNVQNSETTLRRLIRSLQRQRGRVGSFTVCAAACVPGAPGLEAKQEQGSWVSCPGYHDSSREDAKKTAC